MRVEKGSAILMSFVKVAQVTQVLCDFALLMGFPGASLVVSKDWCKIAGYLLALEHEMEVTEDVILWKSISDPLKDRHAVLEK